MRRLALILGSMGLALCGGACLSAESDRGTRIYGSSFEKDGYPVTATAAASGVRLTRILENEYPGLMRLRMLDVPERASWSLTLTFASGAAVTLTETDYRSYLAYDDIVSIPVRSPGIVTIKAIGAAPTVQYIQLIATERSVDGLYVNGAVNLDYFPVLGTSDPDGGRLSANARAVANLRISGPNRADERCSAFQFSEGYFLTNLHCVAGADGAPDLRVRLILEFGDFPNGLDPPHPSATATVVAVGSGASDPKSRWPLDYAVLKAKPPEGFQAAILPLELEPPAANGKLEQYQVWSGPQQPPGKVVSRDDQCVALPISLLGECGAQDLKHECDSEAGSSGSPIVRRAQAAAVALHYYGIREQFGNCALLATSIVKDLKDNPRHAPIWGELLLTPTMKRLLGGP